MSDKSSQALTVFVTVQFVNISSLFADYILMKSQLPSITDISVKYPVVGVSILLFETISPVSLAAHFWFSHLESSPNRV